ncbi:iron ABC transporter substrate-binding protein [Lampropedia cohaerens]|uniref:Iron ABC transporter substrate-binding protein n=1 Tax=Lampropedia cohaerens TaxID=1610491 RepID=A0A0U1Q3I6_9BURK|nr:MetQ/NlpA family ABC transporter substrate-binding protein [Lampropedia cohaerens]KKW69306.1 iron ABC transporter substrate-binding protein [Lampropedia cohaerens]
MPVFPRLVRLFSCLGFVLAGLACQPALASRPAEAAPLKLGVIAVVANEATEFAIREAARQGLTVELVEFSDWVRPNVALAEGAIDVNFFQHAPFLQLFNQNRGVQLVPVAYGYSTTMGIYSKKLSKGDAIPVRARVAIPSDPVNGARALLLLQSAGLIALKEGVTTQATVQDIVANPRQLRIFPIDGALAARTFDDVDLSVTYASFAQQAGLAQTDALHYDNTDADNIRRYAIRFVTRPELVDDPRIQRLIAIYQHSTQVRALLRKHYGELVDFAWDLPQ